MFYSVMLMLAWVSTSSAATATLTENISANSEQVAGIVFDFVLLAAGVAGLGHHVWNLQETQYEKLEQVCRTLSF